MYVVLQGGLGLNIHQVFQTAASKKERVPIFSLRLGITYSFKINFTIKLVISMENPHFTFFPFLNQYPYLFYQSWSQSNFLCQPTSIIPSKQTETRESLFEAPKSLNQQGERAGQKEVKPKPNKSKRCIEKEKLMRRREREDNYQRKKQKKDRNLPSNIFKNLTNFIYLNPHIIEFVTKLIPSNLDVSALKLIEKFKETIKFGQSYIRPLAVQSLCRQGILTQGEAIVFRIIMRKFLLVELPVLIMNQPKIKRKQRSQYIKMGRKLYSQLNKGVFQ